MDLYKIITNEPGRKKSHFYESHKSYLRGLDYHVRYLLGCKDYLPALTVDCFIIGISNKGQIDWIKTDHFYIDKQGTVTHK